MRVRECLHVCLLVCVRTRACACVQDCLCARASMFQHVPNFPFSIYSISSMFQAAQRLFALPNGQVVAEAG